MEDNLKEYLIRYKQEHILHFYEDLEPNEKHSLTCQIKNIDFGKIYSLYKNSMLDDSIDSSRISPIPYISKTSLSDKEITYYTSIGNEIIKTINLL